MDIEKQVLVAGTDWDWTEPVADYPASTHQLKYLLKKGTGSTITLTATADGDNHVFEIDKATTAGYAAGWYVCQPIAVLLTDANDVHEIGEPLLIQVHADLSTVSDARTHALTMVDLIRTSLQTLAAKTMSAVSIEGRAYTYKDEAKLKALLAQYEREAGIRKRKRVLLQFDNN